MTEARLDAVWAAVYVRVLSATPPNYPADDHNIRGQAAVLGDPTSERIKIAVTAADNAVLRLVEETVNA
jgi:hypothetical protein